MCHKRVAGARGMGMLSPRAREEGDDLYRSNAPPTICFGDKTADKCLTNTFVGLINRPQKQKFEGFSASQITAQMRCEADPKVLRNGV